MVKRPQGGGTQPCGKSARDIAEFLAKQGKGISHMTVAKIQTGKTP